MLNVGVFFDGTGNNKRHKNINKKSNIGKLSDIYRNDNPDKYTSIYVRGVGSKPVTKQDAELDDEWYEGKLMGGAFGYGGQSRMEYVLEMLEGLFEGYRRRNGKLPDRIVFDVFGFSRGAALARNFVNAMYYDKYSQKSLKKVREKKVRFLGIFDTVGSFGWPGNKKDPGYNFHVDNKKAQYVYHLVSEDELRENFDLQSIKPSPGVVLDEANANRKSRWMIEEACPGVHSDIGGGYGKKKEHGCSNNELARVYLEKMYEKALQHGVPFCLVSARVHEKLWKIPAELKKIYNRLNKFYSEFPGLAERHRVLRANERHWELLGNELRGRTSRDARFAVARGMFGNTNALIQEKLDKFKRYRIRAVKETISKEIFHNQKRKEIKFYELYNTFRKTYIHTSHYPANKGPGMDAQKQIIKEDEWPLNSSHFINNKQQFYCGLKRSLKRQIFFSDASDKKDMNTLKDRKSLTCYLRFMVKTRRMSSFLPLPKSGYVRVWDDDLFLDDKLGAADIRDNGQALVFCFDIGEGKDLFFTLHPKGAKVNKKELPDEWDSREYKCIRDERYFPARRQKLVKGKIEDFKGKILGNATKPLTVYIKV